VYLFVFVFRESPLQCLIFAKLGNMTDSCMLNPFPDILKQFCAFFALKLLKCWGHTFNSTLPELLFWNILLAEKLFTEFLESDLETSRFNSEQVWITPVVYIHVLTCIFVQYFLVYVHYNVCFVITVSNSPYELIEITYWSGSGSRLEKKWKECRSATLIL
jgi:hypothetical protein